MPADTMVRGDLDNPGFIPIPADLAVEILSPTDRVKDVGDKVKDYLKVGFKVFGWSIRIGGKCKSIAATAAFSCSRRKTK
jgi:hypothetical protein